MHCLNDYALFNGLIPVYWILNVGYFIFQLAASDNFEERKKIRARIKELREIQQSKYEERIFTEFIQNIFDRQKLQLSKQIERFDHSLPHPGGLLVSSPDFDYKVLGSKPTGGRIQLMTVRRFIAQRFSLSVSIWLE